MNVVKLDVLLGKGSFKRVWKGFDQSKGIEVAWNELTVDSHIGQAEAAEHELTGLSSEVELLRSLDHPHIMKFYGIPFLDEKQDVCFCTELFSSNLELFLRSYHHLVEPNVLYDWIDQILAGLVYLHSPSYLGRVICHRDLKLGNIFVTASTGHTKIGDLGNCAVVESNRCLSAIVGSPSYMAPEIYEESYDERVDVWALGLLVAELFCFPRFSFEECQNTFQVWQAVIKPPHLPAIFDQLRLKAESNESVKLAFSVVKKCLVPRHSPRPSIVEISDFFHTKRKISNGTAERLKINETPTNETTTKTMNETTSEPHHKRLLTVKANVVRFPISQTGDESTLEVQLTVKNQHDFFFRLVPLVLNHFDHSSSNINNSNNERNQDPSAIQAIGAISSGLASVRRCFYIVNDDQSVIRFSRSIGKQLLSDGVAVESNFVEINLACNVNQLGNTVNTIQSVSSRTTV